MKTEEASIRSIVDLECKELLHLQKITIYIGVLQCLSHFELQSVLYLRGSAEQFETNLRQIQSFQCSNLIAGYKSTKMTSSPTL